MDMPIVVATRFESDVGNRNVLIGNAYQVTVASKILGVGSIGFADGENHLLLETSLGIIGRYLFSPYLFGLAGCRPGLGPACIERYMGDDFGCFCAGDTVLLRLL